MSTARPFERLVCKCERCGHEWIPQTDEVYTCAKCRSPYWNKPKGDSKEAEELESVPIVLDEEAQKKAALQCAIVQNFDCKHYKERISVSALCYTCFECEFWNTDKLKMLKEAFSEQIQPEKEENKVQGDEVYPDIQNAISGRDIQEEQEKEKDIPKTPDEILAKLEEREIKIEGRTEQKANDKEALKIKCYKCMEKYKDKDKDWQCNFFTFKGAPKYDYCRLCWELPEIWGDRAVGPKK
jgi:hypothetical protein